MWRQRCEEQKAASIVSPFVTSTHSSRANRGLSKSGFRNLRPDLLEDLSLVSLRPQAIARVPARSAAEARHPTAGTSPQLCTQNFDIERLSERRALDKTL
jgi:hypothetical protein